eukprot:gene5800-7213_t
MKSGLSSPPSMMTGGSGGGVGSTSPTTGGYGSSFEFSSNFSIKDKQIEAINKMLSLKSSESKLSNWQDVWKVMVYDSFCGSVIAPVLTKGALRNQGVTLHLPLHSDRQQIADVPAIYFILPTIENIKKIAEDCKNKLYDSIYLNFATRLSNELMEELVSLTIQTDSVSVIAKVYDQFLNYISLERDLFVLDNPRNSYLSFNDPTVKDTEAQTNLESVVEGLFSVLVTLGVIPIIRCPRNSASEMIATQLEKKISQHLHKTATGNLFTGNESSHSHLSSFHRPVLIIMDRNIDLSVMLHHPWTYQALSHDILGMTLNRVKVEATIDGQSKRVTYDLDSSLDSFWANNSGAPFSNVEAEVKTLINDYITARDKITKITGFTEEDFDNPNAKNENKAAGLSDLAMETKEKKRLLSLHTNLATGIMKQIRDRQIDYFFAMEEAIITRSYFDKKEFQSLITSPVASGTGDTLTGRGTIEDKIRLLLIYFLSTKNIPQSEMDTYEDALLKMGADLSSLDYFKKTKAFNENLAIINQSPSGSSSTTKTGGFMQIISGSTVESFTNFFSQGVRSMLPKSKDLFVTRVVESIMDLKNTLDADYLYLDPKIQNKTNVPRRNTPFKEAIVFMVGGGNYVEYQNLQDFSKKQNKKIIYGSTEILSSNEFLNQIKTLKEHTK